MGVGIRLEVWGDYACFTRPEMKVERVSYDVMTPCAARGLIESIYWKPAIRWVIDRIHVLNPVKFINIRRNEVSSKIQASSVLAAMGGKGGPLYLDASAEIVQRASLLLRDVRYVIEAHFDMTERAGERDDEKKYYCIAVRRMRSGQCFHTPCLGCREFPASFRLLEEGEALPDSRLPLEERDRDLGWMLYEMDYQDSEHIQPVFFRAALRGGVLETGNCEVAR